MTIDSDQPTKNLVEGLIRPAKPMIRKDIGLSGMASELFENINFANNVFRNNNFEYAEFENCNLTNADFTFNNHIKGAKFYQSDVAGANFRGTNVVPEQFIFAINVEKAQFDNSDKFFTQVQKLRNKVGAGEVNKESIFYRLYRGFVKILGGNIKWTTPPPENTKYAILNKLDINRVIELAPSTRIQGDSRVRNIVDIVNRPDDEVDI